jgi:hypothetical protein
MVQLSTFRTAIGVDSLPSLDLLGDGGISSRLPINEHAVEAIRGVPLGGHL